MAFKGVPELPSKSASLLKDRGYAEKRQSGLSAYLSALVNDPALLACEDVRSFLELTCCFVMFFARCQGSMAK